MSLCHKCEKPVFFAERKTSLGKDWHRECLTCAECDKVLHPGQHAQHKGTPYCHVPCYSALFGPTMFGHGSTIEAHTNFGTQAAKMSSPVRKPDLEARLRYYNDFYESKSLQIKSREVNGRLVLEGPLRIHWGVRNPIQLAEKDESNASKDQWRRSYCMAMFNGLDEDFLQRLEQSRATAFNTEVSQKMDNGGETLKGKRINLEEFAHKTETETNGHHSGDDDKGDGGKPRVEKPFDTVIIRSDRKKHRRQRRKRLSIINGHIFNVDTSVFTPAHGSVTSVTVTSLDVTYDVIKQLLEKFKVENKPRDFCLCIVKGSGETRVLKENDCPLHERVMLGPLEDNAKIFIMDEGKVKDIDEDVAHFVSLPDAVLIGFLAKLKEEEELELLTIKTKYRRKKELLEQKIIDLSSTNL